jgi:hypothetical protein
MLRNPIMKELRTPSLLTIDGPMRQLIDNVIYRVAGDMAPRVASLKMEVDRFWIPLKAEKAKKNARDR